MSYFASGFLRAARALGAKDWSHPNCIKLARHMAHDGATADEIAEALGWTTGPSGTVARLARFNIRPRNKLRGRPHHGDLPYLSRGQCPSGTIDARGYRP